MICLYQCRSDSVYSVAFCSRLKHGRHVTDDRPRATAAGCVKSNLAFHLAHWQRKHPPRIKQTVQKTSINGRNQEFSWTNSVLHWTDRTMLMAGKRTSELFLHATWLFMLASVGSVPLQLQALLLWEAILSGRNSLGEGGQTQFWQMSSILCRRRLDTYTRLQRSSATSIPHVMFRLHFLRTKFVLEFQPSSQRQKKMKKT